MAAAAVLGLLVTIADAGEKNPRSSRKTAGELTWDEIQTVGKTPEQICKIVRRHIRYAADQGDDWATGQETWEKKQGDCEDFAACVVDLCKAAGLEATIQIFYPKGSWEGHAAVIGSWGGQLWVSSNGWYETVKSMDDAKAVIAKELAWRHKEILIASAEEVRSGTFALAGAAR